jgi:exodeoxyribonuclease V alpha subunit
MAQPSSCAQRQTEAFRGTTHVEPDDGELTATFDARVITYGFGELLPAYAAPSTREGSEYPAVVIPVITQHYSML